MQSSRWRMILLLATFVFTRVVGAVMRQHSDTIWEGEDSSSNPFGRRRSLADLPLALLNATKDSVDPKLGTELTELYENYIRSSDSFGPSSPDAEEYISVDIAFTSIIDKEQATEVLSPVVQVDFISCYARSCSLRIPVSSLKDISSIDSVHLVHVARFTTNEGSVISEGDAVMYSDNARTKYSVDGSGILIGVISDSYDCRGGASRDIATGDLPSGADSILILSDLSPSECVAKGGKDEGRAMMQLIHDVAPGARLAFWAIRGEPDFANGIAQLAEAGCDVIVDDILVFLEPMLQDGIVAQEVDRVVSQGIPYFSSAGNSGRRSWEAPSGFDPFTFEGNTYHRFGLNSDGSTIGVMQIRMQGNGSPRTFVFQWDDAHYSASGAPGAQSNLDVYFYYNRELFAKGDDYNIGGNPLEILRVPPVPVGLTVTVDFIIVHRSGPLPTFMKLVMFGQADILYGLATNSATSYAHMNAALAAGVGAAAYDDTPAFGVVPPKIEPTSSVGGTPIFISKTGSRLSSPEIRNQPRFTGPDGGATTFFGDRILGVYRFYGTSAAAPHVAAVAALMLERKGGPGSLTPNEIYATLARTSVDMDDPYTAARDVGFDFGTGAGLVNAEAAVGAVRGTSSCGLFGLGIFCPLTLCGIFGRLFGLCRL